MKFKQWHESSDGLESLLDELRKEYNPISILAWEDKNKIEVAKIVVPPDKRNQGIGTAVMKRLQEYAQSVGKPIVLRPEPEKGKKKALDRFYSGLGFVNNRGRNMDYTLSSPMARTMYWKGK